MDNCNYILLLFKPILATDVILINNRAISSRLHSDANVLNSLSGKDVNDQVFKKERTVCSRDKEP